MTRAFGQGPFAFHTVWRAGAVIGLSPPPRLRTPTRPCPEASAFGICLPGPPAHICPPALYRYAPPSTGALLLPIPRLGRYPWNTPPGPADPCGPAPPRGANGAAANGVTPRAVQTRLCLKHVVGRGSTLGRAGGALVVKCCYAANGFIDEEASYGQYLHVSAIPPVGVNFFVQFPSLSFTALPSSAQPSDSVPSWVTSILACSPREPPLSPPLPPCAAPILCRRLKSVPPPNSPRWVSFPPVSLFSGK